jgi:AI-2E family transporter
LISFIPYLGALSGLLVSTCIAIAQIAADWRAILVRGGCFRFRQSLADYVLAPHLVGRRVHLNPVWVMFALYAFGYLFEFLLIAVPLASAIRQKGVLVDLKLLRLALDTRHIPRNEPARQLTSITAISVPSGLRGVRDRLRSFNFCMGRSIGSHQRRCLHRRRAPLSISFRDFRTPAAEYVAPSLERPASSETPHTSRHCAWRW